MTPTLKELTAARDWFKERFGDFKQEVENGTRGALGADKTWGNIQTLLSLLNSHINPPDLSELKRETISNLHEKLSEQERTEETSAVYQFYRKYGADIGVQFAIDHIAPRIVREGCVVVPEEPTEKMSDAGIGYVTYPDAHIYCYKAMIAASKGD